MQKKNIKVGMEVAVETDGIVAPGTLKTYGGDVSMEHGYTYRGVSKRWGKRFRATVKALDQKRPTSGGGVYSSFLNDGVLVEFHEPVDAGYYGNPQMVKTAVLSTKHIIEPWSETVARKEAQEVARIARDKDIASRAEAFRPSLREAVTSFEAAGLSPFVTASALEFEGGRVRFSVDTTSDKTDMIVGWRGKVEIEREEFFKIVSNIRKENG